MARVLISSLGVGRLGEDVPERNYDPADYKFDCGNIYYTSFISAALNTFIPCTKPICESNSHIRFSGKVAL